MMKLAEAVVATALDTGLAEDAATQAATAFTMTLSA
jgi:hypothetical protein